MTDGKPQPELAKADRACPLCARPLKPRWLSRKTDRISIHSVITCKKCRNGFATRRQAAYLVDVFLWAVLTSAFTYGLVYIKGPNGPVVAGGSTPSIAFEVAYALLGWIVLPLLFTLKDGVNGLTPGRLVFNVQVVDRTTRQPIGFGQSCKRNLILCLPYVGFIWVMLTMLKGRRVGDEWAHTDVVWLKHIHKTPFDPRGILCTCCGYDLTGNVSGRCPECGTPVDSRLTAPVFDNEHMC